MNHPEFITFTERSLTLFDDWQAKYEAKLKNISIGDDPKALIHDLSEDLLARFCKADLLDKYDIYQILMDYWAETMQDDVCEIPWVTTTQINFNIIEEADQFITEKGLRSSAAKIFPPRTLLMAMYSQGKTRGKVAKLHPPSKAGTTLSY